MQTYHIFPPGFNINIKLWIDDCLFSSLFQLTMGDHYITYQPGDNEFTIEYQCDRVGINHADKEGMMGVRFITK